MAFVFTIPHLQSPSPPPPPHAAASLPSSSSCKPLTSLPPLCSSPQPSPLRSSQAPMASKVRRNYRIIPSSAFRFVELRWRRKCMAAERNIEGVSVATSPSAPSEEEEDRVYVAEILRVLDVLKTSRDMSFDEVKLTIMIEDPREAERRKLLGVEDERGCSREDMANALVDVHEGRIPKDRGVLKELVKEMLSWPRLEDDVTSEWSDPTQSLYARITDVGVDPVIAAQRAKVDWDEAAEIDPRTGDKDLGLSLPPVFGFSFLYLLSALPIAIGVVVVAVLFVNSLR